MESISSSFVLKYLSSYLYFTGEVVKEMNMVVLFNGNVLESIRCYDGLELELSEIPVNIQDPDSKDIFLNSPLIVLIREGSKEKATKELDPLLHPGNIAGTTFDLSPLLFGQSEVTVKEHLFDVNGEVTGWRVVLRALYTHLNLRNSLCDDNQQIESSDDETIMSITMLSANCLPAVKDGAVFVAAIGMDGLLDKVSVNLGKSLSDISAKKLLWANACTGGIISNTGFSVPEDDVFIPENLNIYQSSKQCFSVYWNTIKRIAVDPKLIRKRLLNPFYVEIAGVPKTGKQEAVSRSWAVVDAGALLEPDQLGLTTCAKLRPFHELLLPEDYTPLLEMSSISPKSDAEFVYDEAGHEAYIVIRIDLVDPVTPEENMKDLYQKLNLTAHLKPDEPTIEKLDVDPPPESPFYDVHRIKREGGALAVHKELSVIANSGSGVVQMGPSIKRTAANRLHLQVRTMLKQFAPKTQSTLDWQETITGQHAAARRAVTASFAPQLPPPRTISPSSIVKARMAGDEYLFEKRLAHNIGVSPNHPRIILPMILFLLEKRLDREARTLISKALKVQRRNKFLLWIYGAQEFPIAESKEKCIAAFRVSVNGDYSDSVANAIGWAALHTAHHHFRNKYAAFAAAKNMRKHFTLTGSFKEFFKRWTEASGQEEINWSPSTIQCKDPLIYAAAFFLCLRCYYLCEKLLNCYTEGCSHNGDRNFTRCVDEYYIRASSWFHRRQLDLAVEAVQIGKSLFGSNSLLNEMALVCDAYRKSWDKKSEELFKECERDGAEDLPKVLLKSALWLLKRDPQEALQRAARAHKVAPGPNSALLIGRIYNRLKEAEVAGQWAECAVQMEPLLADGWAFLAYLAMRQLDVPRARALMRTARQAGRISPDIQDNIDKMNRIVPIEELPEIMVKNFCICKYC